MSDLQIGLRLGKSYRKTIAERGDRLSLLEGDLSIRIGSTYVGLGEGESTRRRVWLRDVLLDDFLVSLVEAAVALSSSPGPFVVDIPSFIIKLRIHRENERVYMTPWVEAPMWEEIPRYRPVQLVAVLYPEFAQRILGATTLLMREIKAINPKALQAPIIQTLTSATERLAAVGQR